MRRISNPLSGDHSFVSIGLLTWVTALGCATAEPLADVPVVGEGGASSMGGAALGGQSGGALGHGGANFVRGGSTGFGGAPASTGGAPSAGGKSSAGAGSVSGGAASAGVSGALAKGGATATGGGSGLGGITAKGGASSAGTSNGGVSSGGVSGGGVSSGGSLGKGGTTSGAGGGALGSGGVTAKGELFFDDFETGNASRWVQSPTGNWSVVADGSNVYKEQTRTGNQLLSAAGDSGWADQIVEARVKVLEFAGQSTSYYAALCARVRDANNFYAITLSSDGNLAFRVRANGSTAKVGTQVMVPGGVTANTWYTLRLEVRGNALSAYLNNTLASSHNVSSNAIATGGVGLATYNAIAVFDDVRVTAP